MRVIIRKETLIRSFTVAFLILPKKISLCRFSYQMFRFALCMKLESFRKTLGLASYIVKFYQRLTDWYFGISFWI